jgi:hypothetical protein
MDYSTVAALDGAAVLPHDLLLLHILLYFALLVAYIDELVSDLIFDEFC